MIRGFLEKVLRLSPLLAGLTARITTLENKIDYLELRLLSYYKNRWNMIDKLADYLVGTQIPGDYLEFGVFEGNTFAYANKVMASLFPDMRFIALDSFEGLPAPKGIDAHENYTSGFFAGQFSCSREQFVNNLVERGVDLKQVELVPGWFDKTLAPGCELTAGITKVAAAWIDCDLYESTVPVLDFLTNRLSIGTVLLFDDWRCYRNLPEFGQQRACREWLEANPQIELRDFVPFGFHGQSFTVRQC